MHEKGKHEIISAYDRNLMGELIQFLESFKEATDNLEGDKEPTLPLAVPWTFSLLTKCEVVAADSEVRILYL